MPSNRAIEAGRAVLRIVAIEEGVRSTINEIEADLERAAERIRNVGASIVAAGLAGLGTLGLAVREASRAEEVAAKFGEVFGGATDEMKSFFRELASEVGRSETDLQEFGAGFQDLLAPIGFDPTAAREFSGVLTQLAVDLASFNNRADGEVVRDLQAALTGSSETVKRYGVIANEAAVKQELLNKGIEAAQATDVDKVYARIAIILRQTTAAQGDAARTAGSVANQMKALAARVSEAAVAIGKALLPAVRVVLGGLRFVATIVRNVAEAFPTLTVVVAGVSVVVTAFGIALTGLGVVAGAILSPITLLTVAIYLMGISKTQALAAVVRLSASLVSFVGITRIATAAFGAFTAVARLFLATPIGLAITAVVVALPIAATFFGLSASAARDAAEANRAFNQSLQEVQGSLKAAEELQDLAQASSLTADEMQRARQLLNNLSSSYGDLGIRVEESTQSIDTLEGAFGDLFDTLKNDQIKSATSELTEVTVKIGELEERLEKVFRSNGRTRLIQLPRIRKELEEAREEANRLRATLQQLRSPDTSGLADQGPSDEALAFQQRAAQRLRDEQISQIEDSRQRQLAQVKEAADRELAEAERIGASKADIEARLALERERINRDADARLASERENAAANLGRQAADDAREIASFAADRREAEIRLALEGREQELALLREQEQEKIRLARERGLAVFDIEREFAARRAEINRKFDQEEKQSADREAGRAFANRLRLARSLQVSGTLATRVAGQQFSRGGDDVPQRQLSELGQIRATLRRIERKEGGIPVL